MSSRISFASILMACLLAVGIIGIASAPNDASAGQSVSKYRANARSFALERKRRSRTMRIPLPIGPSYIYYDYPYYYARGHYPTHIGGYVYYPSSYYSRRSYPGPGSLPPHRARRN
jgi:hypothetical protein